MFNPAVHTVNSMVRFSNGLSEHVLRTKNFFDQSLLAIIERDLGINNSLIVIHGSRENDFKCCAWIEKTVEFYEADEHPYWHFSRQDRCANYINEYCRRINLKADQIKPLFFRSTDIISKADYGASDYVHWLKNNMNSRHHYSLHLPFGSHGRQHLCFYKSVEQTDFSDRELDLAASIYSLVGHAYRVFEKNSILQAMAGMNSDMVSSREIGCVVLDAQLHSLSWNRRAATLLATQGHTLKKYESLGDLVAVGTTGNPSQTRKKKFGNLLLTLQPFQSERHHFFDQTFYCLTISLDDKTVPAPQPNFEALSPRENEIAEKLSQGLTSREIAEALFISRHTVRNHVQNIFQKLEIKNQRQLVSLYTHANLMLETIGTVTMLPPSINQNTIICGCLHITAGDIEAAYRQGWTTMGALRGATYLGSMCRNCLKKASDLLQLLSEKNDRPQARSGTAK